MSFLLLTSIIQLGRKSTARGVPLEQSLPPADEEYDVWPDVDVEAEYGEGSYGFGGGAAVSYTHLTLPTILLV